ncbi:unnamed protein product [Paramecium sonneborni]|uniref:Uncharacterized protein n=1 Tax=Paramecium sonneborni TaxID=65129 RepID=A0A8S1RR92_9CILI|nr:unnamed protein product [Paramecium sonneborni]
MIRTLQIVTLSIRLALHIKWKLSQQFFLLLQQENVIDYELAIKQKMIYENLVVLTVLQILKLKCMCSIISDIANCQLKMKSFKPLTCNQTDLFRLSTCIINDEDASYKDRTYDNYAIIYYRGQYQKLLILSFLLHSKYTKNDNNSKNMHKQFFINYNIYI